MFPPPPPKQRTKPYPKGTVVTGRTQSGIFGFPMHHRHCLFQIDTPPAKREWSNSGYAQKVTCLTCQMGMVEVDSEFLMVKANKADVLNAMRFITMARNSLLAARRHYNLLIEEGKVK